MFRICVFAVGLNFILMAGPILGAQAVTVNAPIAQPLVVAYAPSGKQVAVGGFDKSQERPPDGLVVLVDAGSGEPQFLLRHSGTIKDDSGGSSSSMNMIHAVAYSPDGKTLAVAAELGLKLWDPVNGNELVTLVGYGVDAKQSREETKSIAFSPDGKLLAAVVSNFSDPHRVRLWDVAKQSVAGEFEIGFRGHVAFLQNGTLLVSTEDDTPETPVRLSDGTEVTVARIEIGPFVVDRQCQRIAAISEGSEKMWRLEPSDTSRWRLVNEVKVTGHGPMSPVQGAAFSPDGKLLLTYGSDGVTVLYETTTKSTVATLWAGGPSAFSPDGQRLAVAETRRGRREAVSKLSFWNLADVLSVDRLAEQARMAADELVRAVSSEPRDRLYDVQPRALTVLGGPQGAAGASALIEAMANPQIKQKQLVAMALGRMAAESKEAVIALATALRKDAAADAREASAMALSMAPPSAVKGAVSALVESALNDQSPDVQRMALHALEQVDPAMHRETIAKLRARGPVEAKAEMRAGQLVYQGRSLEEWIERLGKSFIPNEIFGRPSPEAPLAAIRAMGADAVPTLIETLKTGEWPQRQAAAAGLKALGPQAGPAVDSLLDVIATATMKDLATGSGAADAIAAILEVQKELPERLVELTNSDDPTVRLLAASAVAQLEPTHARGLMVLKAALAVSSTNERPPHAMMAMGTFPEQPPVRWLGKIIADDEAPAMERIRSAETLARMKERALPAVPEMIKAIGAKDANVSQHTMLAIQKIGPQVVPAVSEALKAEANSRTRERLAATLWSLGREGRIALKGILQTDDAEVQGDVAESLWWAAACGGWDQNMAMSFESTVREALEKSGQPIALRQAPKRMNDPRMGIPRFEKPTVAWSSKILADGDAPKSMRLQAANALLGAPDEELFPMLPALLESISHERDRTLQSQLANVIQGLGPRAIPLVRGAIDNAPSGEVRRELLRALSSLGDEGQQEFQQLMQSNVEYQQLFLNAKSAKNENKDRNRKLSSLEQKAVKEAERTSRPLTNGDFTKGLDGWNIEGGAAAFRTHPRGDAKFLTTWGDRQDANMGRLFQCFKVPDDAAVLAFKLHGGSNREKTYVALWRNDHRHGQMAARNDTTEFQAQFDLKALRGKIVTLEIVDNNTDGWGFIGVEDFRILSEEELNRMNADRKTSAFDVSLHGKKGQRIEGQVDTASDSFVIRSWSDPAKNTWTPIAKELPLTLYAFRTDGQTHDVPEDWNGKFEGWAFLLPAERDLLIVQWNEGMPNESWKGASFGWGGLRNRLGKVVTGMGTSDETERFRYVPMTDNSTSDINFDAVIITPARPFPPRKSRREIEE